VASPGPGPITRPDQIYGWRNYFDEGEKDRSLAINDVGEIRSQTVSGSSER